MLVAHQVVGEPALVVGNSIGAIATLSAAYVAPEMVKGCALLNAAGRFEAPGVTAEELAKEEADKAAQARQAPRRAARAAPHRAP